MNPGIYSDALHLVVVHSDRSASFAPRAVLATAASWALVTSHTGTALTRSYQPVSAVTLAPAELGWVNWVRGVAATLRARGGTFEQRAVERDRSGAPVEPHAEPGCEQYDVETVTCVAGLTREYLARLLVVGGLNGHASVASSLESCAATASVEGRKEDAARMFDLARRLRGAT